MNSITSREGIKKFQARILKIADLSAQFSSNWPVNWMLPFLMESCYNK